MKKLKNNFGFTLIELLVVIAILGILATVGLRSFTASQIKSRDAQRKSDLAQIQKALEMYYNDYGHYPGSLPAGGGKWEDAKGTLYMKEVPKDKKYDEYYYTTDLNGTYYKLYARLENINDKDYYAAGYEDTDCGGEKCNYGVASSDVNP